jgi:iron complex outermembrane receptor protein
MTGSACAIPAHAQAPVAEVQDAASSGPDDEIVVTALKRAASVQDVPATVTVVSGEAIVKANITSALDLPAITPGVLIQAAPGVSPVASIRGIGTNASNQAFDQSVALFVDGIFLARGKDYASSLFDIGDVQVIKGAQSAVLGKNTTVGAIALTTRRPEDAFGYELSYNHDFSLDSDTIDAALNVPLSDTFAVRVSGRYADLGGWQRNDLLNEDSPQIRTRAARIALRWNPTEDLDWNLNYQHEKFRSEGQMLYVAGDTNRLMAAYAARAGDPNFTAAFNDRFRSSPRPGFPNDFATNKSDRIISNLSYSLGDGYELTAITAYLRSRGDFLSNNNAVANAPVYLASDLNGSNTFSNEIRLTTPKIGIFDVLAGVFYYHDVYRYNIGFDAVAPSPLQGFANTRFKQNTEDFSGFASVNIYPTDRLTINGALRYTHEERSADYVRDVIRPGNLVSLIYSPFAPGSQKRSRSFLDGSVSAQYEIMSDFMGYVSYGKGSKSGGFANAPNNPFALRPDGSRAAEFNDEIAKTFEVGLKIGRGSGSHLNVAFFNIMINDFQTSLFSGTQFIVKNIDIRSRGAEVEAVLKASDHLRFSVNATYADALNKDHLPTERSVLVRAPKWNGIANVNFVHPLGGDLNFSADGSVEFRSQLYFQDVLSSTVPVAKSFAKLGLRLAVAHPRSGVTVALVGRNLTNRRVPNYGTGLFPGVAGAYLASSEPPRTVAIQLSIKR